MSLENRVQLGPEERSIRSLPHVNALSNGCDRVRAARILRKVTKSLDRLCRNPILTMGDGQWIQSDGGVSNNNETRCDE